MKAIVLANDTDYTYNLRKELIEKLISVCDEVVIVCKILEFGEKLKNLGCRLIDIDADRRGTNIIADISLLCKYNKILRKERPDVVLTYNIKPNVYGGVVASLLKIPYIANITGGIGTTVDNKSILQLLSKSMYKFALRKAQKVFFQNKENQNVMLKHGIVKNNYDLLPGSGVNLQHFSPIEYPNGKRLEFVFIGRLMKEKGIDQYLEAAQYIKKKYPDTLFHICGTCEENYTEKLKKLSDDGYIIYHGSVSDTRTILKDVHCTVHPTFYPEGLSNVLLESCASARPIITTDRPGCREVIEDGKNGYIVRQKDSGDLIEKIEKFIALPWEEKRQMGIYGRAKVEREFDRNIVVEKYMKEIEALAGEIHQLAGR